VTWLTAPAERGRDDPAILIGERSTLPGPRLPRPVAGVRFLATEHRMLARYRRRYGDVFAVQVWPFDPLVVVGDPAEVKRIFRGDPAQLHAGEGNRVLGPIVGPRSMLVLDGKEHLRTRKLLLPPFHGARMRVYGDVMRGQAEAEVATWPSGVEFPLLGAMQRLTLRIILRTVFGVEEGARMDELERALIRVMARGSRIMLLPALQRTSGRAARSGASRRPGRRSTSCCSPRSRGAARRPTGRTCSRCCCRPAGRTASLRWTPSCATT